MSKHFDPLVELIVVGVKGGLFNVVEVSKELSAHESGSLALPGFLFPLVRHPRKVLFCVKDIPSLISLFILIDLGIDHLPILSNLAKLIIVLNFLLFNNIFLGNFPSLLLKPLVKADSAASAPVKCGVNGVVTPHFLHVLEKAIDVGQASVVAWGIAFTMLSDFLDHFVVHIVFFCVYKVKMVLGILV